MVFMGRPREGEKGKACGSHVCHAWAEGRGKRGKARQSHMLKHPVVPSVTAFKTRD